MGSRFGPQGCAFAVALGYLLISGTVSTGCIDKTGEPLPQGLMAFPIAIALSPEVNEQGRLRFAFVTSSNFALQYNSGNVQTYDLERMVDGLFEGCISRWERPDCESDCECDPLSEVDCVAVPAGIRSECLAEDFDGDVNGPECTCDPDSRDDACVTIPPDRCSVVPAGVIFRDPEGATLKLVRVEGLIPGEVQIGSFSDGLGVSTDGRRLYVPVRSDANITWIDVNESGQLDCGGGFGNEQTCSGEFRDGAGELADPSLDVTFPADPVDVYVGDLSDDFAPEGQQDDPRYGGDYILVAHREGKASLLLDQIAEPSQGQGAERRPRLVATLDDLAAEQVTITYQPGARLAWIPSALEAAIIRVGVGIDGEPTLSYLFDAGPLFVTGLDFGVSQRDILFDPRADRDLAYIVSRSPEALIVARTNVAGGNLNMVGQVSTCRDPSRVQTALLPVRGESVLLAFVSCFLSRRVNVIDTEKFQGITTLTNISGAFEFVIDPSRLLIYIADFSTSVLRVADLRPVVACLEGGSTAPEECSPRLLGLVGFPQPVSELPR